MTTPEPAVVHPGDAVPILGAMGVRIISSGTGLAVAELPPEPNVNHFGTMYAGSLFSLAECLGGVVALATFDLEGELSGFVPLVKEMSIRFRRPALGAVRAAVSLSQDEVTRIRDESLAHGKAEYRLTTELTDPAGTVVATTEGVYQLRRW